MKVEYRITEDDYAKAMQLHGRRQRVLRWPSVVIRAVILIPLLILVGASLLEWAWDAPHIIIVCMVVVLILPEVAVFILVPHSARRMYRKYKAIQEPMTVELCDDGLRFGFLDDESTLPWRMILEWRQNNQFVLIYTMPKLFYPLPKSVARKGFDIPLLVHRLTEQVGRER